MSKKRSAATIGTMGEWLDDFLVAASVNYDAMRPFDGAILTNGRVIQQSGRVVGDRMHSRKHTGPWLSRIAELPFSLCFGSDDGDQNKGDFIRYSRTREPAGFRYLGKPGRDFIKISRCLFDQRSGPVNLVSSDYYLDRQLKQYVPVEAAKHNQWTNHITDPINWMFISASVAMDWIVNVGHKDLMHVGLSTDAEGVLAFLSDRETGGMSRRASVIHWVERHWRKQRNNPDIEKEVCGHLRGKREFTWRDLHMTVKLPEALEEQAAIEKGRPRLQRTIGGVRI